MIPFRSVLPEVDRRDLQSVRIQPPSTVEAKSDPELPPGEYAFIEFYCEDLNCDCRLVFLQVVEAGNSDRVLANLNYGWDKEAFYRKRFPFDPEGPREIVRGSLDPMHAQSEHSDALLRLFHQRVLNEPFRLRLKRHYQAFREELSRRKSDSTSSPPPPIDRKPALPARWRRYIEGAPKKLGNGPAKADAENPS